MYCTNMWLPLVGNKPEKCVPKNENVMRAREKEENKAIP